jgi:hypothetical protein
MTPIHSNIIIIIIIIIIIKIGMSDNFKNK